MELHRSKGVTQREGKNICERVAPSTEKVHGIYGKRLTTREVINISSSGIANSGMGESKGKARNIDARYNSRDWIGEGMVGKEKRGKGGALVQEGSYLSEWTGGLC